MCEILSMVFSIILVACGKAEKDNCSKPIRLMKLYK